MNKPMDLLKSMVFLTWPVSEEMTMVHPTERSTWTGQLTFPFGSDGPDIIDNPVELNIPVYTPKLAAFFRHWLVNTLKIAVSVDKIERGIACGNGQDYQVWYTPNPDYVEPKSVLEPCVEEAIRWHYDKQEIIEAHGGLMGQHPTYDRIGWGHAVGCFDTQLGYWDWVIHQLDSEDSEGAAA